MCSQPPKEVDDSYLVEENLKMLSLIQSPPEYMGITGGEPTLLGPDLIRLLEAAERQTTQLPTSTCLQMGVYTKTSPSFAILRV